MRLRENCLYVPLKDALLQPGQVPRTSFKPFEPRNVVHSSKALIERMSSSVGGRVRRGNEE